MDHQNFDSLERQANEYLLSHRDSVSPSTAEEYFTILLCRAVQARKAGDYGISAALATVVDGVEIISFGRNTLISQYDPLGHAETNAIRNYRNFLTLPPSTRQEHVAPWVDIVTAATSSDEILERSSSPITTSCTSVLYCTVEPCPLCAVAIMNSRIQKVVIATPDQPAGVLAPERLARLPDIWPKLAASQGLQVQFTTSNEPKDVDTYIPQQLSLLLGDIWMSTRDACDVEASHGVLFRSKHN